MCYYNYFQLLLLLKYHFKIVIYITIFVILNVSAALYNDKFGFYNLINNSFITAITITQINWSKILSGADKTLGVVNQTIPLVRQTKPLFSNMKSMIKLAKAFREEVKPTSNHSANNSTNQKSTNRKTSNNSLNNNSKLKQETNKEKEENTIVNNSLNNTPSFFV